MITVFVKSVTRLFTAAAFITFVGCASTDLTGTWELTMPNGSLHQITVDKFKDQTYYLYNPKLDVSGVYALDDEHLVMRKPNDPRLNDFKWSVDGRYEMHLIEEPHVSLTRTRYKGAHLNKVSDQVEVFE